MLELFKIGFLTVTLLDIIDIAIVSFIFYKLYALLKGTIATQIFFGLILIFILSFIAQIINLRTLSWLLNLVTGIWVIAFIILFQPEIRRLLVFLARNPIFRIFVRSQSPDSAYVIADAAFELSQLQHGAIIVLIKSGGIRGFVETGQEMNAKVSRDLLKAIFFPRSPLHDGAVIIKNDTIEAARCTLPLSVTTTVDGETLGMRHRAGIGITEQADVISIIVSEETGGISIAEDGRLWRGLSKEALRKKLVKAIGAPYIRKWKKPTENAFFDQ
ncbi:MAG: TIGR00159 family protein [Ignavibacteriaceae bacterium]|nr:TIGR00159 family protein [Ignavibacteriaceae bacterium]